MKISLVPTNLIYTCWDQIEGYLDRACKYTYGRYTKEDIKELLEDEYFQLWVAFDGKIYGVVVTQFMQYPRSKYLGLLFCGGVNFAKWGDDMINTLKRYAKDTECDGVEATGRSGCSKLLKKNGHTARWATFELPLEGV